MACHFTGQSCARPCAAHGDRNEFSYWCLAAVAEMSPEVRAERQVPAAVIEAAR